jgi:hypothetical protein
MLGVPLLNGEDVTDDQHARRLGDRPFTGNDAEFA